MPLAFLKINGNVQCICFQNGDVISPHMMIELPETEQLSELSREALKSLLIHAGLKMTNFSKVDKNSICTRIRENWQLVCDGLARRHHDTFTSNNEEDSTEEPATISEPVVQDEHDQPSSSVVLVKMVKVEFIRDEQELPLTFELNVEATLVSDLLDLYQAETSVPKEQVCFFSGIKRMEHFRRLVEYLDTNGKLQVKVQPRVQGGGKRGASGTNKMSKSKKTEDLIDNINTVVLKASKDEASAFSKEVATLFNRVLECANADPSNVLTASLNDFKVEQFQKFQVALSSGNGDHKITSFAKEVFRTKFNEIECLRREFDNLQKGMVDVGNLILLSSQFANDDCSISWSLLSELVGKMLTEKSRVATGTTPTATHMSG